MPKWAPQAGPQRDAILARSIPELLFGGARGGGKSDFLLGDWLQDAHQGRAWRGVIFRQSYPELEELIARAHVVVPQCAAGSEWFKQEKTWRLPTGAEFRMRSLETFEDIAHYQGHSYSWIGWDELAAWPDDRPYRALMATLRSAEGAQCMRVRATANPGGVGHHWVKARFIDAAPRGYSIQIDADTGVKRVFIPSRLEDNLVLMEQDPQYINRLRGVGSPELVRAWLEGDWDAIVGAYFPEWNADHVWHPFEIPKDWLRFRAMDWGSARPTCVLWGAISDGSLKWIKRGVMVIYRELYTSTVPNVGMRLTVEQVAETIHSLEAYDPKMAYSVADPAIFANDGGPSIGERFAALKVFFNPADNRRIGKVGAMAGWDLVRQRLIGEDGSPQLIVFSTCTNLIRTLPAMQHDDKKPEDVDTEAEDHAADALRYACASRPWVRAPDPRPQELNLNLLWQMKDEERARW